MARPQFTIAIFLLFALLLAPVAAQAQGEKTTSDLPWLDGFQLPGFDGEVAAVCVFQDKLFVGGMFRNCGDLVADNLVFYDGEAWHGFEETYGIEVGQITCMTVFLGRLVIGGDVSTPSSGGYSNHIVAFDGAELHGFRTGFSGRPNALLVKDNQLIAGGEFWYAGDMVQVLKRLARWNGSTWLAYGSGMNSEVEALCEYEGDLIVGGRFSTANEVQVNGIARWNGVNFAPLTDWSGSGYATVQSLTTFQDELYAGGSFTSIEGFNANRLARFDGESWSQVGGGITSDDYYCFVKRLAEMDGQLLVGGRFQRAGSVTTTGAVLWDGTHFQEMDGGLDKPGYDGGVDDVAFFDGYWWLSGWFTRAGGEVAHSLIRWDGAGWLEAPDTESNGLENQATALCLWQGELVAGGRFLAAGTTPANRIARFDGQQWHALGEGLDGTVTALVEYDGDLVAGGDFQLAGGQPASHLARWDGFQWHELGGGLDREPEVLAVWNDRLFVGGEITMAGSLNVSNLAAWDGAVWEDVGGGTDDMVRALLPVGETLYVGGDFLAAGSVPCGRMAGWDGAAWTAVPGGADGPVYALAWYDGLVAGGCFLELGGVPCSRIGRFDGQSWHQLGLGFVPEECWMIGPDEWDCWDIFVDQMVVCENRLYVKGISQSGSLPLGGLACWTDTEHWTPLGSGVSGAMALCPDDGRLWVGGGFTPFTGNQGYCLAAWEIDQIPQDSDENWWSGFDSLGLNYLSSSLAPFGDKLAVAGRFDSAGGTQVGRVALWNGSGWMPLGEGFGNFGGNYPRILRMLEWKGDLYACGLFSLPPAEDYVSLARWDGSQWVALMPGVYLEYVTDLVPWGDDLALIGNFSEIDGQPAGGLALFDGATITPVPVEVVGDQYGGYLVGGVAYDGDLVVFGDFLAIDGVSLDNVARWDGASWLPADDGFGVTGEVRCAVVDDDLLYLGGKITEAGGLPASGLVSWDGQHWGTLAGGLARASGYTPQVETLTLFDGAVIAGGYFDQAGGETCSQGLARWTGSRWASLGSGFQLNYSYNVNDMCVWDGDLFVGGDFQLIGDKNSKNIARWLGAGASSAPDQAPQPRLRLAGAYPNPFNGATNVRFSLPQDGPVNLGVYDLRGRLIRVLEAGWLAAGTHEVGWNGKDGAGADMPSGVYLIRLQDGRQTSSGKVLYLR